MSMCASFGLNPAQARKEVALVVKDVGEWQKHFKKCGVGRRDIELLSAQIDRPFLKEQRAEFASR